MKFPSYLIILVAAVILLVDPNDYRDDVGHALATQLERLFGR